MKVTLAAAVAAFALVLVPSAHALCVSCWERVARCESGNRWYISTGNGFHGGLQFLRSTWLANGGGRYASYPHYASRWQQMLVAETLRRRQGLGPWPTCGRYYWG